MGSTEDGFLTPGSLRGGRIRDKASRSSRGRTGRSQRIALRIAF